MFSRFLGFYNSVLGSLCSRPFRLAARATFPALRGRRKNSDEPQTKKRPMGAFSKIVCRKFIKTTLFINFCPLKSKTLSEPEGRGWGFELLCFRRHFRSFFDCFVDIANHVEGSFWKVIVIAVYKAFKATDCIFKRNQFTR